MANFSVDFSQSQNVNLSVFQVEEDQWILDIGTPASAAVIRLSTQQVQDLGLIPVIDVEEFDYENAAWEYLLGVIEQDEMNYVEYYSDVTYNLKDQYGGDFDMEAFGQFLDRATQDLKSLIVSKL
jgi:hypothetical protein